MKNLRSFSPCLAKFRNEKARILQAGGRPLPHIPLRTETEGKPEGLSGSQPETPSSIINIPPSAEDVNAAAIRQEAWKEKAFRDNLGHQARLRQRQIDEAFPEEAEPEPLKPVAPRHYGFMEDMITYFEGPAKIKDEEGQVVGRTKSQRPKWLQDATAEAGYKYDDALKIIEKAKTGKPLTEKQQMFFDRLVEVSRRDYERYGRLEIYLDDMQEGDKFIVDGETFTHKGYDDEGNAIIKDGITYKVPAFDRDQKVMVDDYIETQEAAGNVDEVVSEKTGSEIEPKDTTFDFMGGQQVYEAAVRLVRKISPKAAGNVGVVKKKDDIGIIKSLLASPDKMPSIIRYYVVHGKNAVVKQDRLRGIADREMKEIFRCAYGWHRQNSTMSIFKSTKLQQH